MRTALALMAFAAACGPTYRDPEPSAPTVDAGAALDGCHCDCSSNRDCPSGFTCEPMTNPEWRCSTAAECPPPECWTNDAGTAGLCSTSNRRCNVDADCALECLESACVVSSVCKPVSGACP